MTKISIVCPKCGKPDTTKAGHNRGLQAYACKKPECRHVWVPKPIKQEAGK